MAAGKKPSGASVGMTKICDGTTKGHADAAKLAEFLMDENGTTELTNDDITRKLGWLKKTQIAGLVAVDKARFSQARNHLADFADIDGKPCCGFRLHYRRSGRSGSTLALHDPSGDLGEHMKAALANLLGWMSRERQHQTENRRQITQLEALGDMVLANGDRHGYRLVTQAVIDLDRDGTVLPETMAQLQIWAAAVPA